jgi:hypothetical protein
MRLTELRESDFRGGYHDLSIGKGGVNVFAAGVRRLKTPAVNGPPGRPIHLLRGCG